MKEGNAVIVESKGSHKGNTITSYGSDGARGESGAAIFGVSPQTKESSSHMTQL
ncbi:hypothetical protein J1907_14885 [Lysinibacillus sphaericus]|uniref:hypothetical protein n=1 Tax=Lysinibacillus sphaericus TaxID=1421 RepID=UPI000AFA9C13|nr:hypothetical protein [Lysinibacillus sphaericus]QPA57426.1 hypothetical protein INQ55_14605 [Lysinibacillus sphaericus]QTB21069.1 hypothetical protein J1907_14885 [Lysinibacillus sphaericus]